MSIIYTYPTAVPAPDDLIIISDVSETNPANATRKCTVQSLVNLIGALVPGGGTVTSVATTNSVGAGITFAASPNPITTTGTIDIGYSGATGDILYADTASSLAILPVDADGKVLTLAAGIPSWTLPTSYTLPLAADGTRGGIQIGYVENAQNYPVELTAEKAFVNVPWTDTTYTVMSNTVLGLAKVVDNATQLVGANLVSSDPGRTFAIQKNSSNQLVVNVPSTGSGGAVSQGFSPMPVALCGNALAMTTAYNYYYLTIAEVDMTLGNLTLWGKSTGETGTVDFAVYRYPWGTGALMGTATLTGATYGPNNKVITEASPGSLAVTAGESIIVAIRRTTGTWNTISDNGLNDAMYGMVDTTGSAFPSTAPTVGGEITASGKRFALTLWES